MSSSEEIPLHEDPEILSGIRAQLEDWFKDAKKALFRLDAEVCHTIDDAIAAIREQTPLGQILFISIYGDPVLISEKADERDLWS